MQRKFMVNKPFFGRILMLAAIYCAAFFIIVAVQFSGQGNFSIQIGLMQVRGRSQIPPEAGRAAVHPLDGRVTVSFGGLEFNLANESLRGLYIVDAAGNIIPTSPQQMVLPPDGGGASFIMPGGASLHFTAQDDEGGTGIRIAAALTGGALAISLPFRTRHSLIVSDEDLLGLTYGGSQYFFSAYSHVEESRRLVLSAGSPLASYGAFLPAEELEIAAEPDAEFLGGQDGQ